MLADACVLRDLGTVAGDGTTRARGDGVRRSDIDVYLDDHLAGSTMGRDLAQMLASREAGTPLGTAMSAVAAQIVEDRATLERLIERLGTRSNPVKRGATWLAEKAMRVKFGAITGRRELGTFLALEALALGIEGKRCMWLALAAEGLDGTVDLPELIRRAETQRAVVEEHRLALAGTALRRP